MTPRTPALRLALPVLAGCLALTACGLKPEVSDSLGWAVMSTSLCVTEAARGPHVKR